MSDHLGELLGGRFWIGDLLGVGGSASVYAAEDLSDRDERGEPIPVAVKVLHPHLCSDDRARDAFLREAREAERLRHPNIAAVRGSGLHDAGGVTMAWIALDLVDGGSVADRVARTGPLPPAEAAAVVSGVLAGLAAAHEVGLVHRDVSPQNVLLRGTTVDRPVTADQVRLVDFGLADATGRDALGQDILRAERGDGGLVLGNAHYMSPEQAQGLPVRAAGDLYQAGALLYFLLTGQPPFPRDTVAHILEAHVSAPPPVPSALAPGARPLDRIVTRAMTKTPARRFRDAGEFRLALAEAVALLTPADPLNAPDPDPRARDDLTEAIAAPAEGPDPATRVLPLGAAEGLGYLEPGADAESEASSARTRPDLTVPLALAAVVAVIGLAVAGVWGASALGEPTAAGTPTPRPTASATPTPTETPTESPTPPAEPTTVEPEPELEPEVVTLAVPTLHGTLADAEAALAAAGLRLGAVHRTESPEAADRVLGQRPAAGESVPEGTAVDVTVASGRNTVPPVSGLTVAAATALLQSAGFGVGTTRPDAQPTDVVTATEPASGAVLSVGVTVTLRVPAAPVEPSPTPTDTPPPAPPGAEEPAALRGGTP
ncbi:protein kinase domain-containing protein [Microbacterium album]|uniref:non-specific serine/threonine protein kinase n=1 Tax=Microbacterium album TaxID=2053191 RepID=A0A917IH52_9MICO|nr:PASTA domain-containing protein [Microbacterium album]GGH51052.1 hypothetical protein GCM10010921_30250 [Microbacterium album]